MVKVKIGVETEYGVKRSREQDAVHSTFSRISRSPDYHGLIGLGLRHKPKDKNVKKDRCRERNPLKIPNTPQKDKCGEHRQISKDKKIKIQTKESRQMSKDENPLKKLCTYHFPLLSV